MELKHDQHFLADKEVIRKLVEAAELSADDVVLEIGPGKGAITKEIAKSVKEVIAVEIDEEMRSELSKMPRNVELIFGNILTYIEGLKFNKIVSNVPFSISEPLFKKLCHIEFEKAVLILGESFYDLLNDNSSRLSTICKVFFDVRKADISLSSAFVPNPAVKTVVLVITKRKTADTGYEKVMREFILQSDKKVKNALMFSLMKKDMTKKQAKALIEGFGLDDLVLDKVADVLSNPEFVQISAELQKALA